MNSVAWVGEGQLLVSIWSLMDNFALLCPWHLILPGWHSLRYPIPLIIVIVWQSLCSSLHIKKTFLIHYPVFIHFSSTLETIRYVNTFPELCRDRRKMSYGGISNRICLFTSYRHLYFTATAPSWCGIRIIANYAGFLIPTLEVIIVLFFPLSNKLKWKVKKGSFICLHLELTAGLTYSITNLYLRQLHLVHFI